MNFVEFHVLGRCKKRHFFTEGIYNFRCSNTLNTYELLLSTAILMGFKKPIDVIHLDKEKFCGLKKNLTMDCSSIKKYDIFFKSSIDSIKDALQRPFRTK